MATEPGDIYGPAEIVSRAWDMATTNVNAYNAATTDGFERALAAIGTPPRMNASSMRDAITQVPVSDIQPGLRVVVPEKFDVAEGLEPAVEIPRQAQAAGVLVFESQWRNASNQLAGMFEAFIRKYFPNECGYLQHAQKWICNAIENGGTGIKPSVEAQIWERERSRILRDARRVEQEVVTRYASMGWPMPPGAMHAAINNSVADAQNQIAESSRTTAIEQAKMEVENVRFAVDKAIDLYGAAMSAARAYIGDMINAGSMTAQVLPSTTDSQARLIQAANSYYQSRISIEEMKLRAQISDNELSQRERLAQADLALKAQTSTGEMRLRSGMTAQELALRASTTNGEWAMQAGAKNMDSQLQIIRNRLDAAIEAAKALSVQAAAMLNALHISTSTSASGGTSYSYSGEIA